MAAADVMRGKAKPPGSLGLLEEWAIRLSEIQGTLKPRVDSPCLLLFAADHGITSGVPGVSAYPRQVTPAMFGAISRGQAASTALCAANGVDLEMVDVGVDADLQPPKSHAAAGPTDGSGGGSSSGGAGGGGRAGVYVFHAKVARGSRSFADGPAMSEEELDAALAAGAAAVSRACERAAAGTPAGGGGGGGGGGGWGGLAVAVGELGIGNTTAASALAAALTGADAAAVCGRGTGVDDAGLETKRQAVRGALAINADLIRDGGARGALRAVGGLELAAMAGAFLEAARRRVPAVVDGFVSGAAALAAARIDPAARGVMFASHQSAEAAAKLVLDALGLRAPLHMDMRLGEGTGAVLALPLLRSAAAIMSDMASLDEVMAAAAGTGP